MPIDNYARVVSLLDDQVELAEKAVQMVMNRSLRELCADLDAAGAEMSEVEIAGLMQLGAIWDSVEAGEGAPCILVDDNCEMNMTPEKVAGLVEKMS